MTSHRDDYVAGVLGGMGPLASTAFLQTIYNLNKGATEQATPHVVMISNPSVEDRTSAFLKGQGDPRVLERGIERLLELGSSEIYVCCFTMHYLLPRVRPALRARVVSLIDAALDDMLRTPGRMLLGCTVGSRRLGLFEKHPLFERVAARVCFPDDDEQVALHDAIYKLKREHTTDALENALTRIAERNDVSTIVVGCTELHLLSAGKTAFNQRFHIVDPLITLARRITEQTHATTLCA
jgi:aspartate racemase